MYASLFGGVLVRGEHTAVFQYSQSDRLYHGRIVSVPDKIEFTGDHPYKLMLAFQDSLVDYFVRCRQKKKEIQRLPVDLSNINFLT